MKQKTINALIEMGMPANIKGFKYIVDVMVLLENDEKKYYGNVMGLYQEVANKNNTSSQNVERAIRHAFSIALKKGDTQVVYKYLPQNNTTNSNLLHVLYLNLMNSEEE